MAFGVAPDLLALAKAAGSALAEADRQALLARAEYHTAIRRLHLAGASLREIADTLSLSHQRVQQIVHAAGGSWWTRVWRARNVKPDAVCTWCRRPPSEVSKLVAGPTVYICEECVAGLETAMRAVKGNRQSRPAVSGRRCSFCKKWASTDRPIVGSPGVCGPCLTLCREIMTGRA